MTTDKLLQMVNDMETIEKFIGRKGRFVSDMFHISIKDLAKCIRAPVHAPVGDDIVKTLAAIAQIEKDMSKTKDHWFVAHKKQIEHIISVAKLRTHEHQQ